MNAKGCCTPIQITISVSIIFILYALPVVVLQIGNNGMALNCACIIASLYSALIIWLSEIVYLIKLGFKCLEYSGTEKNASNRINTKRSFLKSVFWNGQECFARQFFDLQELVKIINSLFNISMMISLGGLTAYGIIYAFFLLEIWKNLLI